MEVLHIGLGRRGRQWLEIVQNATHMTSVGCVDSEPSAREWVKMRFSHIACYERLDEAIKHCKIDAAIIATPPALHAVQTIELLESGCAVLLEPPFAVSLTDGVRMQATAYRTGQVLMIAQNYRYAACECTLRQLLHTGKVGTITHISCIDHRPTLTPQNFLAQIEYAQLLAVGVHHFDSLRSIVGSDPVQVIARCRNASWSPYQHGSITEAFVEMEHNIHVQYYGSLTSNYYEHKLWIEGDKGVLWTDRSQVWWRKRGWRFFVPIRLHHMPRGDARIYPREGTTTLLEQFTAAIREKRIPETSAADNLWTLSIMEAVRYSDQTGKIVRIPELFSMLGVLPTRTMHDGQ
jgi:predicted dehydrogenase